MARKIFLLVLALAMIFLGGCCASKLISAGNVWFGVAWIGLTALVVVACIYSAENK